MYVWIGYVVSNTMTETTNTTTENMSVCFLSAGLDRDVTFDKMYRKHNGLPCRSSWIGSGNVFNAKKGGVVYGFARVSVDEATRAAGPYPW